MSFSNEADKRCNPCFVQGNSNAAFIATLCNYVCPLPETCLVTA